MKFKRIRFLIVANILGFCNLGHAFETPPLLEARRESMQLPMLTAIIPASKIRITREKLDVERYRNPTLPDDKDDGYRLKVELNELTPIECNKLKKSYAGDRSLVDCTLISPSSVLNLTQFLEPAIQATDGKTYPPENVLLSRHATRDDSGWPTYQDGYREEADSAGNDLFRYYDSQTNCWGVAWEIARKATDSFHVYVGDVVKVMEYMLSHKNVETIVSDQSSAKALQKRLGKIRYGDILVIKYRGFTKHVATFVDRELLFERKGNQALYLNRLISLPEILAVYPEEFTYGVIRPRHAFPLMTDITKIERIEFGPKSDDYEGVGFITYYNTPYFDLTRDLNEPSYRLGAKRNAVQARTIELIEQVLASGSPELKQIHDIVSQDPKIASTLSAENIDVLANKLISDRDGLTTQQILLRSITKEIDQNPSP